MRYAVAHLNRLGLLTWEGHGSMAEGIDATEKLSRNLQPTEAAYLVRATPPEHVQPDAVSEWLDQALDLLVTGPQEGITIVRADEGPQFRRLRSAQ